MRQLATMRALVHDPGMNSRVHPKYKTKYRVNNWAENQELCLSLEGHGVRILLTGYKARNSFFNAKLQLDV